MYTQRFDRSQRQTPFPGSIPCSGIEWFNPWYPCAPPNKIIHHSTWATYKSHYRSLSPANTLFWEQFPGRR